MDYLTELYWKHIKNTPLDGLYSPLRLAQELERQGIIALGWLPPKNTVAVKRQRAYEILPGREGAFQEAMQTLYYVNSCH